jgi:hypothetical protein
LNCYSIWLGCVTDLSCVIEFLLLPENIPANVIPATVPASQPAGEHPYSREHFRLMKATTIAVCGTVKLRWTRAAESVDGQTNGRVLQTSRSDVAQWRVALPYPAASPLIRIPSAWRPAATSARARQGPPRPPLVNSRA